MALLRPISVACLGLLLAPLAMAATPAFRTIDCLYTGNPDLELHITLDLAARTATAWTGNADWSFGDRKDYRAALAPSSAALTEIAFPGMPLAVPTSLINGQANLGNIGYYACNVAP